MKSFEQRALELFQRQVQENPLYRTYVSSLGVETIAVENILQIPFLPISFFKTAMIRTGNFEPEICFESSGTTGTEVSRHCIRSLDSYLNNAVSNFKEFYGEPSQYCFLALLPSYLERNNSSLVVMADRLIKESAHPLSGFYLHNLDELTNTIKRVESNDQKTILLGVTFALLDLSEQFQFPLQHTLVMETGGMKGRRAEMTRTELHTKLKSAWGLSSIHAEYGMTELQSQSYSKGDGRFYSSSTMKVVLRSLDDPFELWDEQEPNRHGAINVIDLANVDTIAFIATDDVGVFHSDGSFEVSGRIDNSDIRGCSQLVV